MFSEMNFHSRFSWRSGMISLCLFVCFGAVLSCTVARRARFSRASVSLSIPEEKEDELTEDAEVVLDSILSHAPNDPLLMNAIREDRTGEMYATDVISASHVVARFKNVAERNGKVSLVFDIMVPEEMISSRWQLKFWPDIEMGKEHLQLEPVYITGKKYRAQQLRGYQKYQRFIDSIILDSTYFIRKDLLEIFLKRNFPEIYKMKSDSSFVEETEGFWGVTEREVIDHYTRMALRRRHRSRWENREARFRKYVRDPIPEGGIRLDSVVNASGMLVYSYTQPLKVRREVKKVLLYLPGNLYENGKVVQDIPPADTLEFYITSLSALMDKVERMKMKVLTRQVSDRTKAFINFPSSRYEVDTAYWDNASELRRVERCIAGVVALDEMILDSLVITASCSPEGKYAFNERLSELRSESISAYVGNSLPDSLKGRVKSSHVPENWRGLCRSLESDTLLPEERKHHLLGLVMKHAEEPDETEAALSAEPEYLYLRQKIYPALREVTFDFHLHRPDMEKDTVYTSEPDSVYMEGLAAIKDLDYKKAVTHLRAYKDYNAALACVLADYNHSALEILKDLEDDAKVMYLKAIVYARLGFPEEAEAFLTRSISLDPAMKFRAGLDPELSLLTKNFK